VTQCKTEPIIYIYKGLTIKHPSLLVLRLKLGKCSCIICVPLTIGLLIVLLLLFVRFDRVNGTCRSLCDGWRGSNLWLSGSRCVWWWWRSSLRTYSITTCRLRGCCLSCTIPSIICSILLLLLLWLLLLHLLLLLAVCRGRLRLSRGGRSRIGLCS